MESVVVIALWLREVKLLQSDFECFLCIIKQYIVLEQNNNCKEGGFRNYLS